VQAKIIKLVGLKNGGRLSPINLVTFAGTQNGEYRFVQKKKAICKMISRIVFLISKSVFLISNAIIYFDQQELFFLSASFFFLSSRINFLVSKNLNEIKTKFLKEKFTSKCEIF
jgi:hypothetical protein